VKKHKNSPIWIGGDINLPDIEWESNAIKKHQYLYKINETFIQMMYDCHLDQIVNFPTRGKNILDILLTNNNSLIERIIDIPGISDHNSIVVADVKACVLRSKPALRKIYMWNKANIKELKESVLQNIRELCSRYSIDNDINMIWQDFTKIIDDTMSKIPSFISSSRYNQPWISVKCKRLSRRKKRAYNRAKRTQLESDWKRFRELNSECNKECRIAYNNYVRDSLDNAGNNKKLFRYIKNKNKDYIGVAPLRVNGKLHNSDIEKAEILNDHFCSVFSKDDNKFPQLNNKIYPSMADIQIDLEGVLKQLRLVKTNKACGPDDIHARFLHEFSNEIAPALTILFQASLNQHTVPSIWKKAMVPPLYKSNKNDRSNAENYRPISLTSIVSKILEHILHSNIMDHLNENKYYVTSSMDSEMNVPVKHS